MKRILILVGILCLSSCAIDKRANCIKKCGNDRYYCFRSFSSENEEMLKACAFSYNECVKICGEPNEIK